MKKLLIVALAVSALSLFVVFSKPDDGASPAQTQTQTRPQTQPQTTPQTQTQVITEGPVPYEIIAKGTYSGIKEPLVRIIDNKKDWEELWKKHISLLVPQPLPPEINFNSSVVVAIYLGEKRTSGYQIVLKDVSFEKGDIVVNYRETEPPPNSFTLQVLTQPFVLLKAPKPQGTIRLEKS